MIVKKTSVNTPSKVFDEGCKLYNSGDYAGASSKFEELVAAGTLSGNIYYDLGNSYLRSRKIGKAILNYERASHLGSLTPETAINMKIARSLIKQKIREKNISWLTVNARNIFGTLSFRQLFFFTEVILYVILSCIICLLVFDRRGIFISVIVISVFFIVPAWIIRTERLRDLNSGLIITAPTTDAKFEPSNKSATHFPVYDGMKVYLTRTEKDWYRIKRLDGKIGWIPASSAERIAQ